MRFVSKPQRVDAIQWFKNGDHPLDAAGDGRSLEGKLVRYYRHPAVSGKSICQCGHRISYHGFLDVGGDGHKVCPGDWVVTPLDAGSRPFAVKPQAFELGFELPAATPARMTPARLHPGEVRYVPDQFDYARWMLGLGLLGVAFALALLMLATSP